MMSYASVWLITIAVGCVGIAAMYMLFGFVKWRFVRVLLCGVVLAVLLTPAPVPDHPLNYAPAYIVAVFEGVLQTGGEPGVAVRMLLAGVALVIAVITLAGLVLQRRRRQ